MKIVERGVVVEPGRFGPSRKKEAAARRFGNCELRVFECWSGRGRFHGSSVASDSASHRSTPGADREPRGVIHRRQASRRSAEMAALAHVDGAVPGSTVKSRNWAMFMSYQE